MQKVTRALNTAAEGSRDAILRTEDQIESLYPWFPLPQLTSTVHDLEFAGLSAFPASLGGGHGCSECLHNFSSSFGVRCS